MLKTYYRIGKRNETLINNWKTFFFIQNELLDFSFTYIFSEFSNIWIFFYLDQYLQIYVFSAIFYIILKKFSSD